ncbi:uncharacterized protein METZ01_LOCUS116465 [marine metagenome]|uniref:Uncharacterized protein n=1 Tax=marine metagenome TaxID=408172 RepID=A0A381XGL1_9ZZZZ
MLKVGLIGCGHISETYFRSQTYFNNINIVACADISIAAANKCAQEYNIQPKNVNDLLADKEIDIILNLTNPISHYEIIKKTLLSNKHSYCEKPFSISFEQGKELVELANSKKLYLGNAPDTFLGGGGQLTKKIIDSGEVGDIKLGNFFFAFPGVQSWHPNPEPWFIEGGGPVLDMGPYYYTMLVNLLGPAKNIKAQATTVSKYRNIGEGIKKGKEFKVEVPTSYHIIIEFNNNAIVQGFLSFDVINHQTNFMEFYGTKGSIIGPDPNMFGGPIKVSLIEGGEWKEYSTEEMKLGKTNIFNKNDRSNEAPTNANYRGVGLSDMIFSIENDCEHRCNEKLILHVLDMLDTTIQSAKKSSTLNLRTTCSKTKQFTESEVALILK